MTKTKSFIWIITLWLLTGLACNLSAEATPTPVILPQPTIVETAVSAAPTDILPPTLTPAAEQPTETAVPATDTPAPAATSTAEPVTETAVPTNTAPPPPNTTPVPTQTLAPAVFAPGQQNTAALSNGEFQVYLFNGVKFQPLFLFAETADELDLVISIYEGQLTAESDLSALTPKLEADFADDGGPEIAVFSPQVDGFHTVVVQNTAEATSGDYTLYLYNTLVAAPNTVQETGTLAAGETKTYTATSNGGRPVLVFADPTDQSNLVLQATDNNGSVVAEANYAGSGSAEALFVLPLQTTTYTIRVSEAGGGAANYAVVIVTLE